jgi:hypothetical protein
MDEAVSGAANTRNGIDRLQFRRRSAIAGTRRQFRLEHPDRVGRGFTTRNFHAVWFDSGFGGNEPMPGWASWIDGDLLVVHVDYNGPGHEGVRIAEGSPFGEDSGDPRVWLKLARTLVRVVMGEIDGASKHL